MWSHLARGREELARLMASRFRSVWSHLARGREELGYRTQAEGRLGEGAIIPLRAGQKK